MSKAPLKHGLRRNKEEHRALLRGDGAQFDDTVTTMMLAALEYLEAKTGLALLAAQKFDHYNAEWIPFTIRS